MSKDVWRSKVCFIMHRDSSYAACDDQSFPSSSWFADTFEFLNCFHAAWEEAEEKREGKSFGVTKKKETRIRQVWKRMTHSPHMYLKKKKRCSFFPSPCCLTIVSFCWEGWKGRSRIHSFPWQLLPLYFSFHSSHAVLELVWRESQRLLNQCQSYFQSDIQRKVPCFHSKARESHVIFLYLRLRKPNDSLRDEMKTLDDSLSWCPLDCRVWHPLPKTDESESHEFLSLR